MPARDHPLEQPKLPQDLQVREQRRLQGIIVVLADLQVRPALAREFRDVLAPRDRRPVLEDDGRTFLPMRLEQVVRPVDR